MFSVSFKTKHSRVAITVSNRINCIEIGCRSRVKIDIEAQIMPETKRNTE